MADTKELLQQVKDKLLSRSHYSIKGIGRTFRIYDDDGSKNLSYEEFSKGLRDYGMTFTEEESKKIFSFFDQNMSGQISFDDFLLTCRYGLTKARAAVVKQAFEKFDKTGDGVIAFDDVNKILDIKQHPSYKSGKKTEEEIVHDFLSAFSRKGLSNGILTKEDFFDHYATISANIDKDEFFELMVRNAWKL